VGEIAIYCHLRRLFLPKFFPQFGERLPQFLENAGTNQGPGVATLHRRLALVENAAEGSNPLGFSPPTRALGYLKRLGFRRVDLRGPFCPVVVNSLPAQRLTELGLQSLNDDGSDTTLAKPRQD
jgi:hypothetical protein